MKRRRDELLVGLLLLVVVALGLGGSIWIARGGLSRGYPMHTRFAWGAGLKPGQVVLLAGVQVGFVDKVVLVPDGTIDVTLSIRREFRIPTGTTASVEPNGIFGDQLIALHPQRAVTTYLAAGDTIPPGGASPALADLLGRGDSIATDVKALTGRLRADFVDAGGIAELRRTVGELSALLTRVTAIAAEQSRELSSTQAQLRRTLAAIDSATVDSTLRTLRATTANLDGLTRDLRATNSQVQGVLGKVESGPGTAARLLNDPALFARLDTVLARVDTLVIDLKANPRKYVNLRIF
jgi:phospholipid/cholesterol/gamma-HCH transport system substrate-binding protein